MFHPKLMSLLIMLSTTFRWGGGNGEGTSHQAEVTWDKFIGTKTPEMDDMSLATTKSNAFHTSKKVGR